MKEDIRKIQEESNVTPVSPRQFGRDDDAIHCDQECDVKDKDWFPSNRLKAELAPESHTPEQRGSGVSTSQSQRVSGSQHSFLNSWTSSYKSIGGEHLRFIQILICECFLANTDDSDWTFSSTTFIAGGPENERNQDKCVSDLRFLLLDFLLHNMYSRRSREREGIKVGECFPP